MLKQLCYYSMLRLIWGFNFKHIVIIDSETKQSHKKVIQRKRELNIFEFPFCYFNQLIY